MSKKKISNYVFRPGFSYNDNLDQNSYDSIVDNIGFIKKEATAFINSRIVTDTAANTYPNAVSLLTNNKAFIQQEIIAWTNYQVSSSNPAFVGYTYDSAKCIRDSGYVIDALIYDLRYGGNSKTKYISSFYFINGIAQVRNISEALIYGFVKTLIQDYIFTKTLYTTQQSPVVSSQSTVGTAAEAGTSTRITSLLDGLIAVLNGGVSAQPASVDPTYPFAEYTFSSSKCERDLGYVLEAYLHDIRYGGNEKTNYVSKFYWDGDTPLVDGTRLPEIVTHTYIGNLIVNNIITNIAAVPLQSPILEAQTIDTARTPASGTDADILNLVAGFLAVVTNGLSSMPALVEAGYGKIKFQGRAESSDLLLITNTTFNEVIYNFTSPSLGGVVNFEYEEDSDFVKFLQTTDAVTSIHLFHDTSAQSSTDDIQIFVETKELKVRPYDFGTDAIERMRIAAPQSMLDADFEYGLQPTKWQAIATQRGYPSIYEVPGTDQDILSVTTDASSGTSGIGGSLITVVTAAAHGFSIGTPITVKGLNTAISGVARAEGTFVIVSILSSTSFTYYAKAKVGTTTTTINSTTTQIRQGGFYTGADIGSPVFTVVSNGSTGTFSTVYSTPSGGTKLAYSGTTPSIGAPLTASGINTGTQITAVTGGGGIVTTPQVVGDYPSGTTEIIVNSASGIVQNLGVNDGSGNVTFIQAIDGTTLTLSNPTTAAIVGNTSLYTNQVGENIIGSGTSANFSVVKTDSTSYGTVTVTTAGSGYWAGDTIKLLGTDLGGASPANDLFVTVSTVTDSYLGIPADSRTGSGIGATFNIDKTGTNYSVTLVSPGANYAPGNQLTFLGASLGGITPLHNLVVTVTGVIGGGNNIDTFTFTGTAGGSGSIATIATHGTASPTLAQTVTGINNSVYTTASAGTGAVFSVLRDGTTYSPTITSGGSNYTSGDTFTIPGTTFTYGASPANDLTLTVSTVTATYLAVAQDLTSGSGLSATFNIVRDGSTYSVTSVNPGSGFNPADTITIYGTTLGGSTPANDLTITVGTVGVTGNITAFTTSGTAGGTGAISGISGAGTANNQITYASVTGTNVVTRGTGAVFSITRAGSAYTNIISNGGADYAVGNRITFLGTDLGGTTTTNDYTILVDSVSLTGEILSVVAAPATGVPGVTFDLYSSITISEATTATISASTSITFSALSTIRIDFSSAHGILPGGSFIVVPSSDNGVNNHVLAGGSYTATSIPTLLSLTYQARAPGAVSGTILGKVYSRPDSFFTHRPFDGGVQLGTGGPQHGSQAIRQSKKYIRYQSGKGIMYTTGALFAPSYDIQSITSSGLEVGSTITVTLDENDHGLQIGAGIRISGVDTGGYNGDYLVDEIVSERVFKIIATRRLGSKSANLGFSCQVSTLTWHGASVRAGVFDDQNGIFWEYDGQQLAVVQRSSTKQLAGTVAATPNSNQLTGTNTRFRDQLKSGDIIVLRGMTHTVSHVDSQTSITVTPDFRGVSSISGAKVCYVFDKRVLQEDFNIDRLDGTGPSGYNVDITKMQMIGIQFTWYGAGFIDFMLRGSDGNFVFAHRMRNSNVNSEAFMRTGNLPVRYEVINVQSNGQLSADITSSDTTIPLVDATTFPTAGTVYIDNELISYTGKFGNNLTGAVRTATMSNFQAGANRSYTAGSAAIHSLGTGVVLASNTTTPLISHWGSAFLTDGRFDEDRGYLFSYTSTGNSISTTKKTVFLIRLAPSVSNAVVGDLGERELLNRAQLLLQGIAITSDTGTGGLVVEGVLNPQNYPANPSDITWGKLSGLSQGGQPSFAQIAPGGSVNWNGGASITTATATTLTTISGNAVVPTGVAFNRPSGTTFAYVTKTSWDSLGAETGQSVSDAKFPSGTTVTGITARPTPTALVLGQINGSATATFTINAPSNVLYFNQGSWSAMQGSTSSSGVIYTNDTNYFPDGTYVTAVTGPSGGYYTVSFSQNTYNRVNNNASVGFKFNHVSRPIGSTTVYFTQTSWAALPVDVISGQTTNDSKFTGGTTISSVSSLKTFAGTGYYEVVFSAGSLSALPGSSSVTFTSTDYYTLTFSRAATSAVNNTANIGLQLAPATTASSFLYFTKASWEALSAGAGTEVASTEIKFPAGTRVQTVSSLKTFASTQFYTVTFTQSASTAISGGSTVTFQFGQPAYALPGETVFSFITNPGGSDTLDLSNLKELTTTALGGRGAFPNGPDVLAINVYKVSGTAINANIILRWSEAQA